MQKVKWIRLPNSTIDYARKAMNGSLSFSRIALREVDLEAGVFETLMPEDIDINQTFTEFEYGGKLSRRPSERKQIQIEGVNFTGEPISNCYEEFAAQLGKSLNLGKFAFFENWMARPSDEGLRKYPINTFFLNGIEEVFHYVKQGETLESINQVVKNSVILPTSVGFLVSTIPSENLNSFSTLDLSNFTKFPANLEEIYVLGTYDGESLVRWRKLNTGTFNPVPPESE